MENIELSRYLLHQAKINRELIKSTDEIKKSVFDDIINFYAMGLYSVGDIHIFLEAQLINEDQFNEILRIRPTNFMEEILFSDDTMASLDEPDELKYFTIPSLTVIIPVYNRKDVINQAIDSIYATEYPDLEVIISDDASDEPYNYLYEFYPNIRIIRSETNFGAGVARQKAIDIAHGDYICFLDADDTLDSNIFDELKTRTPLDDQYDIIQYEVMHEKFDAKDNIIYPSNGDQIVHGKIFRREFLIENKIKFHPKFRYYEDSYFARLAIKSTSSILDINRVGYYLKDDKKSTTKSFKDFLKDTSYDMVDMNCTFYELHGYFYSEDQLKQECVNLMDICHFHYQNKNAIFRVFDCLNRIYNIEDIENIKSFLSSTIINKEFDLSGYYEEWKKTFDKIEISIIIPTYNSHEFLTDTLRKLYSTIEPYGNKVEVILSDDNSDNPYYSYLLNEFKNIRILFNNKTVRMGGNRNRGLKVAKGKWVTFLDHDDIMYPIAFKDILSKKYEKANVNIIRGRNRNVNGIGSTEYYDYTCIELLHGIFYRREFLREHNIEFSSELHTSEDSYFNRRAFSLSVINYGVNSIIDVDETYYLWTIHNSSTMHKTYNGREYTQEFYPEYVKACILAFETNKLPEKAKMLNYIFLIYHAEYYIPIWKNSNNFRKANIKILIGIILTLQDRYNIGNDVKEFINENMDEYIKWFKNDIKYFNITELYYTNLCLEIIDSIDDNRKKYLKNLLVR